MGNVILKPTRLAPRKAHASPRSLEREPVRATRGASSEPPRRRRKKNGNIFRGAIVTIGAMLLTVAVIKANDSFNPQSRELVGGVGASAKETRCREDMVYVSDSGGGFCVDRYEASASKLCPVQDPGNQFDTNTNISQPLCTPVSVSDAPPWTNVPLAQAMELCARVGKHLTKNSEWYRAALGTPDGESDTGCVLGRVGASHAEKTGTHSTCVSSSGAYDMVGNVWEWIDANVVRGTYGGRILPDEGYVSEADVDGVAIMTSTSSSQIFHGDYLSIDKGGVEGMFRGGFWNMSEKAGVSAINATIPTSFIGVAVGFRCAR